MCVCMSVAILAQGATLGPSCDLPIAGRLPGGSLEARVRDSLRWFLSFQSSLGRRRRRGADLS